MNGNSLTSTYLLRDDPLNRSKIESYINSHSGNPDFCLSIVRLFKLKLRNWHCFLKSCDWVPDDNVPFLISGEIRGPSMRCEGRERESKRASGTRGGWVVNFLSATPVTSAKVTGPFITCANRSPVSRREAVLQVFRQHRNTSESIAGRIAPATNGRRRLPRRPFRRDARVTTSGGGNDDDTPRSNNRFRLDKSTISEKFVEPLPFKFHGPLKR